MPGAPASIRSWRGGGLHLVLALLTLLSTTIAGTILENGLDRWLVQRWGGVSAELGLLALIRELFLYCLHLLVHPAAMLPGLPFGLAVFLILGCHEMGHYLACRYYRVPASLPYFIPAPTPVGTFGAIIRIRGVIPHRRALFDIGLAGPVAGILPTVPILAYGLATAREIPGGSVLPEGTLLLGDSLLTRLLTFWCHPSSGAPRLEVDSIYLAGWLGMLATTLNLFPVGQLDGGHVVYALSRRAHRLVSHLTIGAMLALVAWSLSRWALAAGDYPWWIVWTLVLLILGSRHPPVRDPTMPLGAKRYGWTLAGLALFILCFMPHPLNVS
jgi:membrane-associated protease RseP (regulator of RpoE activity)